MPPKGSKKTKDGEKAPEKEKKVSKHQDKEEDESSEGDYSQGTKELLSGKYLTSTSISHSELLARLKKLANFLSKQEQETTVTKDLESVAAALVQERIIANKDDAVKTLAACCLADIIRLFAPDAPYNDPQLETIFKLFINQLEKLGKSDDPLHNRYIYLLERLVLVKAFILLVDINPALVSTLFSTLFDVMSDDLSNSIRSHFLEIMISCLEESPEVSEQLLEAILKPLVSPYKHDHPAAERLAQTLLRRFSNTLQNQITTFLRKLRESESELKDSFNELVFNLYRVSPSLVVSVLPLIEHELKVDDNTVRNSTVSLLSFMFSAKGSTLASSYRSMFIAFLGRFNDTDVDIRLIMLDFAKQYLCNHQTFVADVQSGVEDRLQDGEPRVRHAAAVTVCDIASEVPENVSEKMMNLTLERTKDKKESVRKIAITKLAALYAKSIEKSKEKDWSSASVAKVSSIPTEILSCYYLRTPVDGWRVEKSLEIILPEGIQSRTEHLLKLFAAADKVGKMALIKIIQDKRNFQREFGELLELRHEGEESEKEKKIHSLSSKLPDPDRAREGLRRILTLKETGVFKSLAALSDVNSSYKSIVSSRDEILRKLESKKVSYFKKIVTHLSMTLVNADSIPHILTILKKKSFRSIYSESLKLLEDLSFIFPSFLSEAASEMIKLLDEDEFIVNKVIVILANVGKQLGEVNPSSLKTLKEKMLDMATNGTPYQAKYAVKTLANVFGNKKSRIFGPLLSDLAPLLDVKEKKLHTVLKAIGWIAHHDPGVFESQKQSFIGFLEELLSFTKKESKKKKVDDRTWEGEAKALGLKVLIHYLASADPENAANNDILLLLFKIIITGGDLTDSESTSYGDRALLRQTAACGILKLMCKNTYERRISPKQFQVIAYVMQDEDPALKLTFAAKIYKLSLTFALPVKYISIFALAAVDNDKNIVSTVRSYLQNSIKRRNDYMKANESVIKKPTVQLQFIPEHSLPYLVFLLAHHKDFDKDEKYVNTYKCLSMLLEFVFQNNNYSFLMNLLHGISRTKDAVDPASKNIHIVAQIATKEVIRRSGIKKRIDSFAIPQFDLHLPAGYFALPSEREAIAFQQAKLNVDFQMPEPKKNPIFTPSKRKPETEEGSGKGNAEEQSPTEKSKRRSDEGSAPEKEKESEHEREEEEEEEEQEEPLKNKKKRKKGDVSATKEKTKKKSEDKEEPESDNENKKEQKKKKPSPKKQKTKKKSDVKESDKSDQDNSEPEVTKKPTKSKTTKKKSSKK